MSQRSAPLHKTSSYQPHTGDHQSTMDYSQSIRDFSVPRPIAKMTGIDDLSEYNGFEHRDHTFITSSVITEIRRELHQEHRHTGTSTDPQCGITAHSAVDRTISSLTDTYDNWFESAPDGYDKPTSDGAADPQDLYKQLMTPDPLNWRDQPTRVPYAREAHRQIIVSTLALLLDAVGPHKASDEDAEKQAAKERLQYDLTMQYSMTLSREEVLEIVNETFDNTELFE